MKVQLLATDIIKDLTLLSKLLTMQLFLLKKGGKKGIVVNLLSKAIDRINDDDFVPEWRLMTTSVQGEFEFTVVFFAANIDGNLHEYPLYRVTGNLDIVQIGMRGAGVMLETKNEYSMLEYILDIKKIIKWKEY